MYSCFFHQQLAYCAIAAIVTMTMAGHVAANTEGKAGLIMACVSVNVSIQNNQTIVCFFFPGQHYNIVKNN